MRCDFLEMSHGTRLSGATPLLQRAREDTSCFMSTLQHALSWQVQSILLLVIQDLSRVGFGLSVLGNHVSNLRTSTESLLNYSLASAAEGVKWEWRWEDGLCLESIYLARVHKGCPHKHVQCKGTMGRSHSSSLNRWLMESWRNGHRSWQVLREGPTKEVSFG